MCKPSKASLSWECVDGTCILFVLLQLIYFRTLQQKMQTVSFHLSTALRHIGGVEVHIHSFLTMVLDRGEWSTSHPGRFTSGWGNSPASVGPGTILEKRKIPYQDSNPGQPST